MRVLLILAVVILLGVSGRAYFRVCRDMAERIMRIIT
jgi:hypothetical protein